MSDPLYTVDHGKDAKPVYRWTKDLPLEDAAAKQIANIASLPIIHHHVAVMPDVHYGKGATVGSVIPTLNAIIPAAVGVDIGCGMCAVRTSLHAEQLPDNLRPMRTAIEAAVPHGRTHHGGRGDRGAWGKIPRTVGNLWQELLAEDYSVLCDKHPKLDRGNDINHLGTLGTGNHFIEVCLDQADRVWFMLHSGSRGVGNRIGMYFINLAKKDMSRHIKDLPDQDLAYLTEGTDHFQDYVEAVTWAQEYAALNRRVMMQAVIDAVAKTPGIRRFSAEEELINCHHNYVQQELHYGEEVWLTRKGAVRAGAGEMGIIPGSMGARSYIVRGKGNPSAFQSCSHGAGRAMSRTKAKKLFSVADHAAATAHVECRKDAEVVDETPMAYKDIDTVMAAQADLVDIVHTLRQIICVKG